MAGSIATNEARLTITGRETAEHTVPADVLIRVLQGLQQTALLLEAATEQRPIERRFRPSEALRRLCQLRCGPLIPSSVAVAVSFSAQEGRLFRDKEEHSPMPRLFNFLGAVVSGQDAELSRLVPDSRFRDLALRATLGFLPRSGQRWELEMVGPARGPIRLTAETRRTVEHWFDASAEESMVVTGRLLRIDFDKNRIDIRYPPTKKVLRCAYEVDAEDDLFRSRRGWVQVKGRFELDDNGQPVSVSEVSKIEPLDLSPLTFDRVERDGRALVIEPPLALEPRLDQESFQLLDAELPELRIDAYATTREALVDEVVEQLLFLWDAYALRPSEKLDHAARLLKAALLQRMREVTHAP